MSASVTDATSGPAQSQVSAAADTSSVGTKTATVTGTDNAGNEASTSCAYRVSYRFGDFAQPVDTLDADGNPVLNEVKAGQAIPLKWRLTDATGAPSPTSPAPRSPWSASPARRTPRSTRSRRPPPAPPGCRPRRRQLPAQLEIPKSYAGSCKQLRLDLGEGSYHTADFKFTN